MLKKNQLALILLTLVLMLTVYYITNPFEKDKDPEDENPTDETTGRIEELTSRRVALRDERYLVILGLDAIIASNDSTITEKENALKEKRYLNSLTEKELLLEMEVIDKGFRDCFVHATDIGVEITVVSEEHSNSVANEILIEAAMVFGVLDTRNVVIHFKTAEQVMGEVS